MSKLDKPLQENDGTIPLMNKDATILNKILANQIRKYISEIKGHDGVIPSSQEDRLVQRSKTNLCNSPYQQTYHPNRFRKTFEKLQHLFRIKTLSRPGIKRNFF